MSEVFWFWVLVFDYWVGWIRGCFRVTEVRKEVRMLKPMDLRLRVWTFSNILLSLTNKYIILICLKTESYITLHVLLRLVYVVIYNVIPDALSASIYFNITPSVM